MAYVIATAGQKGGTGKTTVSMNLAGCLGAAGYNVLLVDGDPQASSMGWRLLDEQGKLPFEVRPFPYPTIHKDILRWMDGYDFIIIDCPPGGPDRAKNDNITKSAMMASHVVIVPVRPSPLDYQASKTLLPLLEQIQADKPDLKIFLVLNGKPTGRTRISSEAREVAAQMFAAEGLRIGMFNTELHTRAVYVESPSAGDVVVNYDPKSKASEEIQHLAEEVVLCLSAQVAAAC